jgi:iron complex transport system ATP-binding protein
MISAAGLTFGYGPEPVLRQVGLIAEDGAVLGLVGPNGSGKTTLLRLLYAELAPDVGMVSLDEALLSSLSTTEIARRIAVVAQEPPTDISMSVADMVLLGRSPRLSVFQGYSSDDKRAAAAALSRVGARHLAHRQLTDLSGGEKQRVLIARTLAQQAPHLLLDEPTNHLDVRYQHEILALVRSLGVATVVVLHDLNLAARYCDRLILLHRGEVAAAGPTAEVLMPHILEPVYGIGVRRLDEPDCIQLIFQPQVSADPTIRPPGTDRAEPPRSSRRLPGGRS